MGTELKTLWRGDEKAIVEAGSKAEADLRKIRFTDAKKTSAKVEKNISLKRKVKD